MRITLIAAAALAASAALAGCASLPGLGGYGSDYSRPYPNSAGVYVPRDAQQVQNVRLGVVIAVQPVQIDTAGGTKAAGEGIGALAGGLLGHTIGHGNGRTLATVAGAVGGAVAGDAVASHRYAQNGLQITVRLDGNRGVIAVTQAADPMIAVGQRVEVIGNGYGSSPARVEPIGQ